MTYPEFLTKIFTICIMPKRTFLTFHAPEQRYIYNLLARSLERGHVREFSRTYKSGRKRKTFDFLMLTQEGITYLINDCTEFIPPWICTLNPNECIIKLSFLDRYTRNAQRLYSMLNTLAFVTELGANSTIADIFSDNYDTQIDDNDYENNNASGNSSVKFDESFLAIQKISAAQKDFAATTDVSSQADPYVFISSVKLKQNFTNSPNAEYSVAYSDIRSGKYFGVIENKKCSLMLFYAEYGGFRWVNKHALSATQVLKYHKKNNSISDIHEMLTNISVLMVNDSKQFADVYLDKNRVRHDKNGNETETIGSGFDKMYMVPINPIGVAYLKWLMRTKDNEYNQYVISQSIKSGKYAKNTGGYSVLFPLISNNIPVYIGIITDITQMQKVTDALNSERNIINNFAVMCLDWQADYYTKIFPEAEIIVRE